MQSRKDKNREELQLIVVLQDLSFSAPLRLCARISSEDAPQTIEA